MPGRESPTAGVGYAVDVERGFFGLEFDEAPLWAFSERATRWTWMPGAGIWWPDRANAFESFEIF